MSKIAKPLPVERAEQNTGRVNNIVNVTGAGIII
jgi:hypothetical protein